MIQIEKLARVSRRRAERRPLISVPLSQSVFTEMESGDRALVVDAAGQRSVSSQRISDLFSQFNININPPVFTLKQQRYAFKYITAVVAVGEKQSRLADPALLQPQRDEITIQIQAESDKFSAYEDDLAKASPSRRLTKEQTGFVRYIAENGYRQEKLARVIEKEYPLDIEHSAIPAMSFEQIYGLLDIGDQIWVCIGLKSKEVDKAVKDRMKKAWKTKEPAILDDDLRGQLEEQFKEETAADFRKAFQVEGAPLPQEAQVFLTKLGLELKDPVYVRYALKYILAIAFFKTAEIVPGVEESGVDSRRSFARDEAYNLEALHTLFSISRAEMMQIREAVEEAFRTHPQAYSSLELVPYSDSEEDNIDE